MGYEMFRLLSSKKATMTKSRSRSKVKKPEVIDIDEEEKHKSLLIGVYLLIVTRNVKCKTTH